MKKNIQRLIHSVTTSGLIKTLSHARLYRDACERYGLVYFGAVDTQADEHTMVRGLTVSAQHRDRHYCVGSVESYDIILLERTDQLFFPHKQPESYRWTILQIDLDHTQLPHVFLDAHHHQSAFYDAFLAKYPHLRRADANLFADHDPRFVRTFSAHVATHEAPVMLELLTYEITATLGHHFSQYDFELFEDKLLVYNSNRPPTKPVLDDMFRAGVWLAREIEKITRAPTTTD